MLEPGRGWSLLVQPARQDRPEVERVNLEVTPKGRNSGTSYLNLPHTYCKGTSMGKQKPEGRGGYLSVRHTAQHPTGSRMEKREG